MAIIMIVGAGRVGLAAAKIIRKISTYAVVLVDAHRSALDAAQVELFQWQVETGRLSLHHAADATTLRQVVLDERPDVIMCSTPFTVNVQVAQLAAELGISYLDFTEDNQVTQEISKLDVRSTFVPQTGLAPGLVSYLGLELFERLGSPASLDLRVGALPQVAFGPAYYAITWSPEGLINEYLKPALRKRNHLVETVPPLQDRETVLVGGAIYEAFTTSGGAGDLDAYGAIPSVEYKTLRHPGHLEAIKALLEKVGYDLAAGVEEAKRTFHRTRDDTVVLMALAVDQAGLVASVGFRFKPHAELGLTALELTTAGTGVAVAELMLAGRLPTGILKPNQISMSALRQTAAYHIVMSTACQ